LLTGLLMIAPLEVAYRFCLYGPDAFSKEKMNSLVGLGKLDMVKAADHREMVYDLRPQMEVMHTMVPFKTNSDGLRDKEYPIEKPENTFRVAVVGDSFVAAQGVRIEDAFHTLVEDELNAASEGRRYEFISFGVGGYTFRQHVAMLQHKASAYQPDLVLVGFCLSNDHNIRPEKQYHEEYQTLRAQKSFYRPFMLEQTYRSGMGRIRGMFKKRESKPGFSDEQRAYVDEYMGAFAEYARKQEVPVAVIMLGLRQLPLRVTAVRELATRHGLPSIDLSASFKGKNYEDFWVLPTDGHPNVEAHRIYANDLSVFLREQALLP